MSVSKRVFRGHDVNVVELDYSGFDKALARGTPDDFSDVSARLGVDLDVEVFARLRGWIQRTPLLPRARLLALIRKALWVPEGFVWEPVPLRGSRTLHGAHVLAVKWTDGEVTRITIGMKHDAEPWAELDGWSKTPHENRGRVDAWARATAEDRVTVTVRSDLRIQERGDEDAFVRAIVERPDEESLRLAYADWLEERGDVRAELIREQLGLVRGTTGRHLEILETSWPELAGELRPWASPYKFSGGMVAALTMSSEDFLREGERLFARHPLRELSLGDATAGPTTLERIAQSPALLRLEELSLECRHGRPLTALARSPCLGRLKELRFLGGGHSTKDWVELFSRLRAPALESVLFIAVHTHPSVLRAMAENPSLGGLRHLNEASVEARFPDERLAPMKRLFRGDELFETMKTFAARASFKRLALAQPHDGDAVAELFFSSSSQASLEWLELAGPKLTDATLRSMRRSPSVNELTRLVTTDASFSAAALCVFLKSEVPMALRELVIGLRPELSWTPAEFAAVYDALLARPSKSSLKEVTLPPNAARDEAKWLALQRRYTMSEA